MAFTDRLHNRGSISTGFDIDNSLKFEPDNSEYLGKTPTSSGNRKTFTISMWIKRTEIGVDSYLLEAGDGDYNQSDRTLIKFDATDNFRFGGGSGYQRITNRVFRDTSAWYHIVMAVDTTDSTAANRLKLYVNGVQETSFSTSSDPAQNFQYAFCKDDEHTVGYNHTDNVSYYPGYMSEVILIDGQQLDPTSFGEFDEDSGIWKPIDVSGLSFGTNGFYLDFKDASNLGNDASGGTDFTLYNITAADQATDTPTNNFCTFNIITAIGTSTYTEGGTVAQANKSNDQGEGTIMFSNGNWYFEMQVPSSSASADAMFGFAIPNEWGPSNPGDDSGKGFSAHSLGRWYYNNNGHTSTDSSTAFAKGDIVSLAINTSSEKAWIAINGTWATGTDPATGTGGFSYGTLLTSWESGSYLVPAFRTHYNSGSKSNANFGGYTTISISSAASDANGYGNFEYAPPSGYYALCTKNLAEYG